MNLRFYEGNFYLSIGGWDQFFFLYKNDMFSIPQTNNASKQERFNRGLKSHQTTKKFLKLKKFYKKRFTAKDFQKEIGLKSYISSHKFLRSLIQNDFILIQFKNNVKYHLINPKKVKFLKQIWSIDES